MGLPKATNSSCQDVREMVYGEVVNVRTVPSRGVTQVVIEIPSEFHISVTTLLFGKNAFVFPGGDQGNIPYGVATLEGQDIIPTEPQLAKSQKPSTQSLDIVKWLGIRCREGNFQRFLGVKSDEAAVNKVRDICMVDSRADIPLNDEARELFYRKIYEPYNDIARPTAIKTSKWHQLNR